MWIKWGLVDEKFLFSLPGSSRRNGAFGTCARSAPNDAMMTHSDVGRLRLEKPFVVRALKNWLQRYINTIFVGSFTAVCSQFC